MLIDFILKSNITLKTNINLQSTNLPFQHAYFQFCVWCTVSCFAWARTEITENERNYPYARVEGLYMTNMQMPVLKDCI